MKNWTFLGSWAKLEVHIVVRPWVSLGNTSFMGGLWSNGINFDDVHCYEILTRALVPGNPKKSPRDPRFWPFFWSFFIVIFYGESSLFYDFLFANRRKVLFFWIFKKKIEMLVAPLFGPWHTSVFFSNPSKFSQLSFDDGIFTFWAIFHYIKKS